MKKTLNLWGPVFIWAGIIFLFSSHPTSPVAQIHWKDFIIKKSAHVVVYAILTAALYRAFKESGMEKVKAGIWALVIAVLYGVSDEYHQSFTPGRDPQARDVIFDTIGSALALYIVWKLLPIAPRKLRKLAENLQLL